MGFVDRGGGREAKGASLRRSKKNPGAPAARKASAPKPQAAARVLPTPPPFSPDRPHVDAAVAIFARKLDADCDMLMRRAAQHAGVAAALTWCGDFERQEAIVELCRQYNATSTEADDSVGGGGGGDGGANGKLYCLVGVHVNNVDRTHKKVQQSWVERVVSLACHPEVIGLLSGLNLGRDSATHFAQEWLLQHLWYAAGALQLPLVLHICHNIHTNMVAEGEKDDMTDGNLTVERAAELLTELIARRDDDNEEEEVAEGDGGRRKAPTAIILYNGVGALTCSPAMRALVRRCAPAPAATKPASCVTEDVPPIYVLATAEGLLEEDGSPFSSFPPAVTSDAGDTTKRILSFSNVLRDHITLSQLLIGTDSPWNTPQSIPDAHTRTMPNEPANYCYVVDAVYSAMTFDLQEQSPKLQELHAAVRDNFLRVFFAGTRPKSPPEQQQDEKEADTGGVAKASVKCAGAAKAPRGVHFDPSITTSSDVVLASPDSTSYYLCLKCRRRLFHKKSLLTHEPDAAQKHFADRHTRGALKANKRSEANATCNSVYFLPAMDGANGEWVVNECDIVVCRLNRTVSCGGCGAKIGTAGENLYCPCGCTISGQAVRVAASKVEEPARHTAGGDLDELLLQAAREREQMQREELEAALSGDRNECEDVDEKRKREPKKNVKANNRSNFTHFRNKNFAPRQQLHTDTDVKKSEESNGDWEYNEEEVTSVLQRGGRRRNKRRSDRRKDDESAPATPGRES